MPFVKPGTLLQLQIAASKGSIEAYDNEHFDSDTLRGGISMCIVCGSATCSMTPVYVNGVYVHREEAMDAKAVEVVQE